MSICTAARAATRTRKATPKAHRLDRLYDRLVAIDPAAAAAERDWIAAKGDREDRAELHRAVTAMYRVADLKAAAERALLRAILSEAGVRSITVAQYNQACRPYAVVRTARRVYAVIPDNCGEFHPDPATTGFVAVLDL